MRNVKRNKILCKIIAVSTAFACVFSSGLSVSAAGKDAGTQTWKHELKAGVAAAEEEIVKILTADDLVLLARECALDEWSAGKTVLLEADIDLSDSAFSCIPVFGGTFDGQGHTITGFSLKSSGDVQGFFRYLQKDGIVKNLTVEGKVTPDGHKDMIGGLVGSNSGLVNKCTFSGTVKGKNQVGGIAGVNEANGQLINCKFEGELSGEHYAGGIVGQNLGSVVRCSNSGGINTTEVKISMELSEFDLADSLTQLNSVENVPACTDIGGIAGSSSGVLQSCTNYGEVGYEHVGYNIGGIVGRHSGYLDGCTNEGSVRGRKDVGGIAGQFEPEMVLRYNAGTLSDLLGELETMQRILGTTITDAKGASTAALASMQVLSESAKDVQKAADDLTEGMIGWADENIQQINDFSARISWAMDRMDPAADSFGEALSLMGTASGQLSEALKEGAALMQLGSEAVGDLSASMDDFEAAVLAAEDAAEDIKAAIELIKDAIGDPEDLKEAFEKLGDSYEQLGAAFEKMEKILEAMQKIFDRVSPDHSLLAESLGELGTVCGEFGEDLCGLGSAWRKMSMADGNLEGIEGLLAASEALRDRVWQLQTAGRKLAAALTAADSESAAALENAYARLQKKELALEERIGRIDTVLSGTESFSGAELKTELEQLQKESEEVRSAMQELEALLQEESGSGSAVDWLTEGYARLDEIGRLIESLSEMPDGETAETETPAEMPDGETAETETSAEMPDGETAETEAPAEMSDGETAGNEPEEAEETERAAEEETQQAPTEETGQAVTEETQQAAAAETQQAAEAEAGQYYTLERIVKEGAGEIAGASEEGPGKAAEGGEEGKTSANGANDGSLSAGYGGSEGNQTAGSGTGEGNQGGENDPSKAPDEDPDGTEAPPEGDDKEEDSGSDIGAIRDAWKSAGEDLKTAAQKLRSAITNVGDMMDKLEEAGSHGTEMLEILSKASSTMKSSFSKLADGVSSIRSILSELAGQPAIQFTPLNSRLALQKDALHAALGDMGEQLEGLGTVMGTASGTLLSDMEALNNQFGVIIRLLRKESQEEPETLADRFEDVSDESDDLDQGDGVISGSRNAGEISGDVNVAGIVGSMAVEYDFDPEDDLTLYGDSSLDFSWQTSAVLRTSQNTGQITAKKNYAGGIVGRMDLGRVSDCESYGAVQSSQGSYVGGIAGASYAVIRDCWAKCSLSGTDYIGGIAGLGTAIKGCRSLIEVEEGSAFLGTIAGWMDDGGQLEDNAYVHSTLAAVDSISYAGRAEPVSFDELLSGENTPETFRQFELTFMADDEVVAVVPFQYGAGITSLPEIPAKAGYSAKWPDIDYTCLTFSRTLEAEYTPYESALAAAGEVPWVLVDGNFSSEAVIEYSSEELSFLDEAGKEHAGTAVTVKVEDPVLEEISYTVHYRLPEQDKKYRLWVKTDEGWEQADYEIDGAYLLLNHSGREITFLAEPYSILWMIAAAAAAAAVLLAAVLLLRKKAAGKKRKKKNKHKKKA